MLGFTRLDSRDTSWKNVFALSLMILSTLITLFVMIDSFFLHRPEIKSILSPLQRNDLQSCVMTYSYPTFTEINAPKPDSIFSNKYVLYLYREGYLDNQQLHGTPALFIPGQAGSHKQIRSLASTTTNIYHSQQQQLYKHNIDYFTVDLNEELSALDGQTLLDQAEYMNAVVARILDLYKTSPNPPKNVLIIGHSMGGLIARTMFILPNYIPNSIQTILTLATPHIAAPLLTDSRIFNTYRDVTAFWKQQQQQDTALKDVVLVSIAGGSLDNIIHSDGVNIDTFVPESHGFTTYTTSIPNVWTGADHMAILWCNQLIRLLSSTLLEAVSKRDRPVEDRINIFRHNLLENGNYPAMKDIDPLSKKTFAIGVDAQVLTATQTHFTLPAKPREVFLTAIDGSKKWQFLTNEPVEQQDSNYSFELCVKNDDVLLCKTIVPRVTLIPSTYAESLVGAQPCRLVDFEDNNIESETFDYIGIVNHGQEANQPDGFFVGYAVSNQPAIHTHTVWEMIWNGGMQFNVDQFQLKHVFPHIKNSFFAYDLHIDAILKNETSRFKPMMEQAMNGHELKFYRGLESGMSERITFHQETRQDNAGLFVGFYLDGQSLNVTFRIDWYGTLGRCILRYGGILLSLLWTLSLVVLLSQLYSYAANGKSRFTSFNNALVDCTTGPFLQLVLIFLLACLLQYFALSQSLWRFENIPQISTIFKHLLFGSDDWILVGVLMFGFGLSVGLIATIWFAISAIVFLFSKPLSVLPRRPITQHASMKEFVAHLTVSVGLLAFVPSGVLVTFYVAVWIFMVSFARISAKSDLPSIRNIYNYRLSWLIFLVSLLPYYIPGTIVYIKNLLIGWTHRNISLLALLEDMPILLVLIYLVTLGKNPDVIELRFLQPLIFMLNGLIIYQALFGFLHPFILSLFSIPF